MKHNLCRILMLKPQILLAVLLLMFMACGCRFTRLKPAIDSSIHSQKDVAASYEQTRLRLRSLVGPMCGEIEQAADEIYAGTTNTTVQRTALLWKIEGVPAMRAALFQPNPYTALMDAWILCNQMEDYFEVGPGRTSLAEANLIAVATCQRLEEEMNRVAASISISGDVSKARAFAQQWADDHPIHYSIVDREISLSRALEMDTAAKFSAGDALATLTSAVDDLNRRLEVYSEQLFRQARWEAELFKSELMAELPVAQALPLAERAVMSAEQAVVTVERLAPTVERTLAVAESSPKLVTAEREAVVRALQDELTRTLKFVREELTRTLKFMQEERTAVLDQLGLEREAALQDLNKAMGGERETLTSDLDYISLKAVDHAFWRAAQLLATVIVFLAIGLTVVVVSLKRKQTQQL